MLVNLDLGKDFKYLFVHQKDNPQKPHTKVKRIKGEMQATLETKIKTTAESPRSVFKRKDKIEEGGGSRLEIKKKQESTEARVQKMMKGIMTSSTMPTLVSTGRQSDDIP